MTKYIVTETLAVWVAFPRVIEASDEAEARELYLDSFGEALEPQIGESVEGYDDASYLEVLEADKESLAIPKRED